MDTLTNLTPAEKMYKCHLMNVSNYQKRKLIEMLCLITSKTTT